MTLQCRQRAAWLLSNFLSFFGSCDISQSLRFFAQNAFFVMAFGKNLDTQPKAVCNATQKLTKIAEIPQVSTSFRLKFVQNDVSLKAR